MGLSSCVTFDDVMLVDEASKETYGRAGWLCRTPHCVKSSARCGACWIITKHRKGGMDRSQSVWRICGMRLGAAY